jgi:hypothetical protein
VPEIRHSVCALDCPDACSVLVTVEGGKGTRLRSLRGILKKAGLQSYKRHLTRKYRLRSMKVERIGL